MNNSTKKIMIVKIPRGGLPKSAWEKYRDEVKDLFVSELGDEFKVVVLPSDYEIQIYQ